MTNAELIKAIRYNDECNNCAIWKHGECNERKMSLAAADALEAADKRIEKLENMFYRVKWIPTAEREPEENNQYLVTVFFNGETYVDIDDYFCYGWDFYRDAVIAWAELPESYRKEQTDADS